MPKKQKEAVLEVRKVASKEDRRRPSRFTRLRQGESFKGIALFEPDPELDDNPGYFEYYDHYDARANQYVPCVGDRCPFCAANDNPSTRAMTVFYYPEEKDEKEQIKVFTMNFSTINDAGDEAEDEDGMLGKLVRVKRMDDRGDYKVKIMPGKSLPKKELKPLMKQLEELFPNGLEGEVLRQAKIQMQRLKAADALEDDDEDEDEPKARRGKAVDEDEIEDEEEEEEEDEEEDEEDEEEEDEEEDENEDEDEEEEEEEEAEDEEISDEKYEVVKVDEKNETFDLKNKDGKIQMWLGEGVDVDYDEIKKGVNVKVSAVKDEEDDWIITDIAIVKRGRPKAKK